MAEAMLLSEYISDGILLLRLDRPERRNALSTALLEEVARTLRAANDDPSVRVAIITGHEEFFAAGADLEELEKARADDPLESPRFLAWDAIRSFAKPLLAAVEGWCLGAGVELMMCCDIAIAGEGARFGLPETGLGIMPGAGGTATLARLAGRAIAMKLVLTGEIIDAETAQALRLVAECVPRGDALVRTLALAERIAARAPLALREAKACILDAEQDHRDHLLSERRRFLALLGTKDKVEGLKAFKEKRKPAWVGR